MLKRLLIVILFSIAFAYIESAVVVYLRVIYPVLVSLAMLAAAVVLLRSEADHPMRLGWGNGIAILAGCGIIVLSFCLGGSHMTEPDFADYFYWPLFAVGYVLAIGATARALGTLR